MYKICSTNYVQIFFKKKCIAHESPSRLKFPDVLRWSQHFILSKSQCGEVKENCRIFLCLFCFLWNKNICSRYLLSFIYHESLGNCYEQMNKWMKSIYVWMIRYGVFVHFLTHRLTTYQTYSFHTNKTFGCRKWKRALPHTFTAETQSYAFLYLRKWAPFFFTLDCKV